MNADQAPTNAAATISIPAQLRNAVVADELPARLDWLAQLPAQITEIASVWNLELGDPYLPGGQCAWVAPVRDQSGAELVLKLGWRHREAEHEADGLRHWDGDGAVRCYATRKLDHTSALLLERCTPGQRLSVSVAEPEQDVIIASLLRRVWERTPQPGHRFCSLEQLCCEWADSFERDYVNAACRLDAGIARVGSEILRTLAASAATQVLLCTDLHAENVLSARREPWLLIDPKPLIGDPAFDPVQHLLNCEARLAADPTGLARRMSGLLDLDPDRVLLWLFARCVQESPHNPTARDLAHRLAP